MNRLDPDIIDYYNEEVVKMMVDKYGFSYMNALREFVFSHTHEMLEDGDFGLTSYGAGAILEIWEAEKITGSPCNSIYIRGE